MFGGPNNGEVYEFNIPEMEQKQELLIGRTPECDVKINDKLLSKIQCHIKVVNSNDGQNVDQQSLGQNCLQWTLFDGYRNKQSTNGTWLYINTDTLLKNGDIFKANQSIF
jgi:pSer/pThr/pTyr-binding forkhead associated (FHA) protein